MDDDLYDDTPAAMPAYWEERESPAATHQKELQQLLASAKTAKTDPGHGHESFIASAAAACREYIGMGVPCSELPDYAIRTFLASDGWRGNRDVELLFAEYVRAGYIDPKRAIRLPDNYSGIYPRGSRPLEAAAHLGNFDVFETLLDVAANDIDLQEAAAYLGSALAGAKWGDRMLALLLSRNQQMMVERIMRSQASAQQVEGPAPQARRSRRMDI